ncbi:MAG: glycerol-3-phosphate acyltransferase, partial [Deltaproteobacteria bacterium]
MREAIFIVIAYLIGSIPTGFLLAKYVAGVDVREYGSGNIGAT